jgi:tryptophan-rich sensory protein
MALAIVGGVMAVGWLAVRWRRDHPRESIMSAPSDQRHSTVGPWLSLAAFAALTAAAAWFGSTFGPGPWYAALNKPSWNPPNGIFPLVWTPLYVMIALAGWRLWRRAPRSAAVVWWFLQLGLNAAWSWLFFGRNAIGGALIEIIALWLAIGATIVAAWPRDRAAAALLVPYWAWVAFATVLNFTLWRINQAP